MFNKNVKMHYYLLLTLSSQVQPRSSVKAVIGPAGFGLDTSSGMVGMYTGLFRSWLRLPWVPLFGTGFKPSRSEEE